MTKKEAAIVSAYTGFMLGEFSELHAYAEKLLKRPIFLPDFTNDEFLINLKEKAKKDFVSLKVK